MKRKNVRPNALSTDIHNNVGKVPDLRWNLQQDSCQSFFVQRLLITIPETVANFTLVRAMLLKVV